MCHRIEPVNVSDTHMDLSFGAGGHKVYVSFLVLEEINERVQWIEEMEALGEGKKHRATIQLQIAEKLNELKRLERNKSQENEI